MPPTKYKFKFHLICSKDSNGNEFIMDKKYKSNNELIEDVGERLDIKNRNTIYRIINGFHKTPKWNNIKIMKINEVIPHKVVVERRVILT